MICGLEEITGNISPYFGSIINVILMSKKTIRKRSERHENKEFCLDWSVAILNIHLAVNLIVFYSLPKV